MPTAEDYAEIRLAEIQREIEGLTKRRAAAELLDLPTTIKWIDAQLKELGREANRLAK